MLKENLHTHSNFCDGKDSMEDMVQKAIEEGYTDFGFSSHGFCLSDASFALNDKKIPAYRAEFERLKEKYKNKIHLYLGVEEDLSGINYGRDGFEYLIGSVHYVPYNEHLLPVDLSKEALDAFLKNDFNGDFLEYAKAYYKEVEKWKDRDEAKIIGHLDLLMKFNEDESFLRFDDPAYLETAYKTIDSLIEAGKIFEINTGAIARGLRTSFYPDIHLLAYIKEKGGRVMINADCHDRNHLIDGYASALQSLKELGFETLAFYDGKNFVDKKLDEFLEIYQK